MTALETLQRKYEEAASSPDPDTNSAYARGLKVAIDELEARAVIPSRGPTIAVTITGAADIGEALFMVERAMFIYFAILYAAPPAFTPGRPRYQWGASVSE